MNVCHLSDKERTMDCETAKTWGENRMCKEKEKKDVQNGCKTNINTPEVKGPPVSIR